MRLLPGLMLLLPLASPFAQAELIDDVNDRGELRIALEADMPPFSFKQEGRLTGFDVELGELLAQELEVHPSILVTDSNDLLPGVESGKYDVAINHIALTPELQDRFDFSEPYTHTQAQTIARQEKPRAPNTLATLQGQLSGVAQGSQFVERQPLVAVVDKQPVKEDEDPEKVVALAIPFQKGNPAFQASLDKALQRIKADGRLEALSQKWFGMGAKQP